MKPGIPQRLVLWSLRFSTRFCGIATGLSFYGDTEINWLYLEKPKFGQFYRASVSTEFSAFSFLTRLVPVG